MTILMTIVGLVFWFYVLRWLLRLVLRHPHESMAVARRVARMFGK